MQSRYSALSSFNSKTSMNIDTSNYSNWNTRNILLDQIYSNDKNFYEQEGIEEKAKEILSVGLINHPVVKYAPSPEGAYELIDGERRWRALKLLVERGYDKFESVTCRIVNVDNEHEESIMMIIANSSRQKSVSTLIREAQMLKSELQYMRDNGLKLNGYDLESVRIRDVVESNMNTSKNKIAEYEAVGNNLIEEFKEILDKNNITFSAAYQISKLLPEEQNDLFELYKEQGELTYKYVSDYVKSKKEEHEHEQLLGQMSVEDVYGEERNVANVEENSVNTKDNATNIENDFTNAKENSVNEKVDNVNKDTDSIKEKNYVPDKKEDKNVTVDNRKVIDSNTQNIVEKVDTKQDVVENGSDNIEIEKQIKCTKELYDRQKRYLRMMKHDKQHYNEGWKFQCNVILAAYEHYIDYLQKKMEGKDE